MRGDRCWSSIVASPGERSALQLTPEHEWLVACDLPAGHAGSHGSDGAQEHVGRREWLLWDDYARGAQNVVAREPCPMTALDDAARCLYFAGHGGPHRYPDAEPAPVRSEPALPASPRAAVEPDRPRPVNPFLPRPRTSSPSDAASPVRPMLDASPSRAAMSGEAFSVPSLDDLFDGMPKLSLPPEQEPMVLPEDDFEMIAPTWPVDDGEWVAVHSPADPQVPGNEVNGPARFETVFEAPPEEMEPEPVVELPKERTESPSGGIVLVKSTDTSMLEVRQASTSAMTTPMIRVISSNADPVRMGVPTSRRRLPGAPADVESAVAAAEDAAAEVQALPDVAADTDVAAALREVSDALARLSAVLQSR